MDKSDEKAIVKIYGKEELRVILKSPPKSEWVKKHPLYGTNYVPIEKVEQILDHLFERWWCEVLDYSVIANSIAVHIRLHCYTSDGSEYLADGLGAAPIQTKAGASPVDHSQVLTDAVQKALPAAKTFALKDAADNLGDVFGRNVSRREMDSYFGGANKNQINNLKQKLG